MNVSPDILRRDTVRLISQIDQQINEIDKSAEALGIKSYEMRDYNGNWVMAPLLLAKAQAYATLVALQEKK